MSLTTRCGISCPTVSLKRKLLEDSTPAQTKRREWCEEDANCPICLQYFSDPVILSCNHSFCRPCLERGLQHSKVCPLCRGPASPRAPDRALHQYLGTLRKSCEWCLTAMPAADLRAHIEACEFVVVVCTYSASGCGFEGRRSQLATHLESECPYASISGLVDAVAAHRDALALMQERTGTLETKYAGLISSVVKLVKQTNLEGRVLKHRLNGLQRFLRVKKIDETTTIRVCFQLYDKVSTRTPCALVLPMMSSVKAALDWFCAHSQEPSLVFWCDAVTYGSVITANNTFSELGLVDNDVIFVSSVAPSTPSWQIHTLSRDNVGERPLAAGKHQHDLSQAAQP